MPMTGITQVEIYLVDKAKSFICDHFDCNQPSFGKEIDKNIDWRPSITLRPPGHKIIAIEASEEPHPQILRLKYANIINADLPICVYSLCPEDAFLAKSNQAAIKELRKYGLGLMTLNDQNETEVKISCIPLVQHIPSSELEFALKGLPNSVKTHLKEAYEIYRGNAPQGVTKLSELMEGIIYKAANSMVSKGWMDKSKLNHSLAHLIDDISNLSQCARLRAPLGGARAFVAESRNPSHHFPKNKKQAHKKYLDCRHSFRDGLRRIQALRESLIILGIRVRL